MGDSSVGTVCTSEQEETVLPSGTQLESPCVVMCVSASREVGTAGSLEQLARQASFVVSPRSQ